MLAEEESEELLEGVAGVRAAYGQLWAVVKLPAVRSLAVVLLLLRLGMLPAESAAPLKLLERGVSKEALAGLVSPPYISACLAAGSEEPGRRAAAAAAGHAAR